MRTIVDALLDARIGWITDDDGKLWPPTSTHREHNYEGSCAICRAGDRPAALTALVTFIVEEART